MPDKVSGASRFLIAFFVCATLCVVKGEKFMENQKNNAYTQGSLVRAMLLFVGPYLLTTIVQNLYGAVDLLVVGQFATTADVSAVTIGSQLMSMATQFIVGLTTGTTVLIGRYYGGREEKEMARVAGTSVALYLSFAAVLTVLFFALHKAFIALMQTPAQAVAATEQYMLVCALGIVFIVGYNIIAGIMMGMGDTRTPFIFILVACIINVVGDVVLVKFLHMGALGAAIATTLAQAGSVLFGLLHIRKKGLGFSLGRKDIRFDKRSSMQLFRIGGPVAVQNSLVGASFLFITALINQMGLVASASAGIVEKLFGFLIMPAVAFSAAVATVAAQNIGAGYPERAKRSMRYGIVMALLPSIVIAVFCQFGGEMLTRLFSPEAEVVTQAALYLRSYVYDVLIVSAVFCLNGYFNSNGKSWFTLLHSMLTTFGGRVPLCYFLSRMEGATLYTIGWAAPISSAMSLVLCVAFYLWQERKEKKRGIARAKKV